MDGLTLTRDEAYRKMATVRRFEERCVELGVEGLIAGSIHLCFGQEAVPIGARSALTDRDRVLATYRGHGWAIACGVPLTLLLAEICQRAGGVNGGRGGSPYLTSPSHGFVGENSIVGAHLPIAAGVAMAARAQGQDRVVLASFGDGAMNQGAAHEGMVFAAARELPIIFVCENNDWSEMTPIASMVRSTDLAERAIGYGITSRIVDGGDPLAVAAAVAQAADEARRGAGPVFLECKAARLRGHYNRDIEHYRPKHDAEAARAGDPMERLRTALLESGELSEAELDDVDGQVQAAVDAATREVRAMPEPDPSTARDHVRAPAALTPAAGPELAATDEMTFIKAVTAALRAELAARPDVLVYGEDVGYAGGIFGATRGLQEEFGSDRVFDTPIAESAIIGSAVGAAMEGMRPVVEVMWGDFLLVALDQLINQAANVRYLSRSERNAPMVLRTQQGVTPGSCAQHSQSLEAFLAHIPGIKVGLAATPQDAYAMLRAAVADPDPCVVIEARSLYQHKGQVALGGPSEVAAGARLHRDGEDVLLITWGAVLHEVLAATELLAARGVAAAVLDLRWLSPLDAEAIARAVRSGRGHVLVVHEANVTGGFGAEVAAHIHERHFDYLDAPVRRLGVPDVRMPSAPALQSALLPNADTIASEALALLHGAVEDEAALT